MRDISELSHENWWSMRETRELPSGGAYSYIETGDPDKDALVLIHGFGNSSRVWKMIMEYLAADYHIVAVDLRGVGYSKVSDMFAYPIADRAKDVLELMDALGIGSFYVCGHSIGSIIAQAIAMQAPERVRKCVMVASFARMHTEAEEIRTMNEMFEHTGDSNARYSEAADYPDSQGFLYQMADRSKLPKQFFTSTWWGMTMTDHRCFLQFVRCPVLMIWGSEDVISELQREELRKGIPHGETVIYDGIGHEVPSREPLRLAVDIRKFCRE